MGHTRKENDWHNGLGSQCCGGDCGTCMGAWFCPCFLFGRTASRIEAFPAEGTDMCNSDCAILCFAASFGLSCLPVWLRRSSIRKGHYIPGNGCKDFMTAWCCQPCTLAQMESEIKDRAVLARSQYSSYSSYQGGMAYRPASR